MKSERTWRTGPDLSRMQQHLHGRISFHFRHLNRSVPTLLRRRDQSCGSSLLRWPKTGQERRRVPLGRHGLCTTRSTEKKYLCNGETAMRRSNVWSTFLLLLFPFGFAGCQPETANDTEPVQTTVNEEATEGAAGRFEITGEVVSVDATKPALTLDHEEIRGLMKAMTMEFSVDNAEMLSDIQAGDRVHGRLVEKDGQYVITELEQQQ